MDRVESVRVARAWASLVLAFASSVILGGTSSVELRYVLGQELLCLRPRDDK